MRDRVFIVIATLLFCGSAHAANWQFDSTFRTITQLYPNDGGLNVIVDGSQINPGSPCPNRLLISTADLNYSTKVAALLSAFALGKKVQFNIDQGNVGCDMPVNRFVVAN
jgi:hypothetical protein